MRARYSHIFPSIGGVFLLLVAVPCAPAAGAPADSGLAGAADSTVLTLPEVRVETGRTPLPDRASATISRRDQEALGRFQPASTGDALAGMAGVELVKTGAWSTRLALRGVSGERVLLTVDGVRLNTGRGHGGQASLVPLDDLESVEVLPGSGGVFAGSDAMGGVVNLVTRRPMFAPALRVVGSAVVRGATPGGALGTAARIRAQGPGYGLEVGGGLGDTDALVTPAGPLDPSGSHEEHWSIRAAARRGEWRADFERAHYDGTDIGLPAFGTDPDARATYPLQARHADRFDLEWNDGGRPRTGMMRLFDQEFLTAFEEVTTDTVYSSRTRQPIARRSHEANDDLTTRARGGRAEFRVGSGTQGGAIVELRDEETTGPGSIQTTVRTMDGTLTSEATVPTVNVPPATRNGYAFAGNGTTAALGLRFEAGVRFDHIASHAAAIDDSAAGTSSPAVDVTDERVSGEFGIARAIGEIAPYARIATGFRAPSLEERFFDGFVHGGLRVFGNAALVAENSATLEVGVRAKRPGTGSARLSAYRTDADDFIDLAYQGQLYLIPRFQYVNIHQARIEGIELELEAAPAAWNGAALGITAGAPRGTDRETGARLTGTGPPRASFVLRAPLDQVLAGAPPVSVSARAAWSDAIRAADALPSGGDETAREALSRPAFWTCALEGAARVFDTEVVFTVRNLFDHTYREPLSFVDEPGRTFGLTLRRGFTLAGSPSDPGSITP